MTICECVVQRVKDLLKKNGMSQYKLEKTSGIQHGALNRIMRCENKGLSVSTLAMLARGFGMTLSEFVDDSVFSFETMEIE